LYRGSPGVAKMSAEGYLSPSKVERCENAGGVSSPDRDASGMQF